MKLKLAENIRSFRKQRKMTQEQLAEVLGVTVGAVYKWESGQSLPELRLIMEAADFFDVSVDVLLGYEVKDNRLKATVDRLTGYINTEDPEGLSEVEKALTKYPHSFDIVYFGAILYMIFGGKNHDQKQLARASELLEQSLVLLPQNTNPQISEIGIYDFMANVRIMQGRGEEAAELLKQHNREGVYNDLIGMTLSLICSRPEEAQPFLSQSLLDSLSKMIQTIIGKAYAYLLRGDPASAESLLKWGLDLLEGLKQPEITGYIDQTCSFLHFLLAFAYLRTGSGEQAEKAMGSALELADRFDRSPNYDARSVRFVEEGEHFFLHYILGRTVRDSLAWFVTRIADDELTALWKKMEEQGDGNEGTCPFCSADAEHKRTVPDVPKGDNWK